MKRILAPEAKTATSVSVGGLITLVFMLAGYYHWFTPPLEAPTGRSSANTATAKPNIASTVVTR